VRLPLDAPELPSISRKKKDDSRLKNFPSQNYQNYF
jgi:hypothetical protein